MGKSILMMSDIMVKNTNQSKERL